MVPTPAFTVPLPVLKGIETLTFADGQKFSLAVAPAVPLPVLKGIETLSATVRHIDGALTPAVPLPVLKGIETWRSRHGKSWKRMPFRSRSTLAHHKGH